VQDKHLALASRDNRIGIVDYFISKGLKLDYDKALIEACKYGANNVIDKLIAVGANAGAYDNEALIHVLSKDSVLIKKLINAGADINLSKIDFNKIME
jgi:ankyrin repeat protein